METKLLYLEDFTRLTCDAKIVGIPREMPENDSHTYTMRSHGICMDVLILNQTVFYPQGGGQPYDTGVIESPAGKFVVEEVRMADNIVRHIGHFEHGAFAEGKRVECRVDAERRLLHSRIHSAGHLVDWAVAELKPVWTPDPRGYHYPNGPYVTYTGSLQGEDKEKLKNDIEEVCSRRIAAGEEVSIRFMNQEEMKKISRSIPDLPDGKPGRVIMFGRAFGVSPPRQNPGKFSTLARASRGSLNFPMKQCFIPCGGTHIRNLSEIRGLTIRKIKQEGANIRIGYDVAS